jgi:hypothetical protein
MQYSSVTHVLKKRAITQNLTFMYLAIHAIFLSTLPLHLYLTQLRV